MWEFSLTTLIHHFSFLFSMITLPYTLVLIFVVEGDRCLPPIYFSLWISDVFPYFQDSRVAIPISLMDNANTACYLFILDWLGYSTTCVPILPSKLMIGVIFWLSLCISKLWWILLITTQDIHLEYPFNALFLTHLSIYLNIMPVSIAWTLYLSYIHLP